MLWLAKHGRYRHSDKAEPFDRFAEESDRTPKGDALSSQETAALQAPHESVQAIHALADAVRIRGIGNTHIALAHPAKSSARGEHDTLPAQQLLRKILRGHARLGDVDKGIERTVRA